MKAVILAAGKSTRTYPLTLTRPKPLLPILNKPILAHQLDALHGLIDEAVLIVGYRKEMIEERFGAEYRGIKLTYVEQVEQKGTGHAILQCRDAVREPFLAMNGDDLYTAGDYRRLAEADQAALVKHVEDPRMYGIYDVDDAGRVRRIVEKPVDVFSTLANVGVYKFTPAVFEVLEHTEPSERGEIEITSAIQTLAEQTDFRVVEMEGYWLPIGYPWHLLDANEYMLNTLTESKIEGEVSPQAELNGVVIVGKGSVIRAGAVIDGPVVIGENCTVGPNCWLRPGATLGDGSRVGQCCEVKNTILMEGAAVPHLSYVGDSVIGVGSNLGAGTITANFRHDAGTIPVRVKDAQVDSNRNKLGTIIGDNVHTGINTAIYPGRMLWPHTATFPGESVRKNIEETKRRPPKI
jgi:bifunctional UDP-N-acetylglucosamine pyrophosphorylase/glucosamine-1-phosphate N-acetyltransferase